MINAKKCHGLKLTNGLGFIHLYLVEIDFVNSIYLFFSLASPYAGILSYPFMRALSLGYSLAFCLSFYIICILTREYRHSSSRIKIIIRFHNNI